MSVVLGALLVLLLSVRGEAAVNDTAAAPSANDDPARRAMQQLALSIQRFTLPNGLRVVFNVDSSSPTVAVSVTYDVGSRNEQRGRSGFAHLFEHMMFQGSRNVKKGEHFTLLAARGGELNGTTSADRTNYFEVVPLNELALALWLEADRMRWLDVTPENFENQRRVVQEEYRMRVANAAYRPAMMRLEEVTYQDYWPYAHPTIGSMSDLDSARFEWVQDFHAQYYAPNNAVLTVAGNFDRDETAMLIEEYFGSIPRNDGPPPFDPPPAPPPPDVQRLLAVQDANAKTPGLFYGWLIPPTMTEEHYALEMASLLLTDGESSVLHQELVRANPVAREVGSWTFDRRGPDMLTVMALLTQEASPVQVREHIERALARLARDPVSDRQLQRVRNRIRSHFLFRLQSNMTRAVELGEFELLWGDARLLTRQLDGYLRVSAEDIRNAVRSHLRPSAASVVEVVPAESDSSQESRQ